MQGADAGAVPKGRYCSFCGQCATPLGPGPARWPRSVPRVIATRVSLCHGRGWNRDDARVVDRRERGLQDQRPEYERPRDWCPEAFRPAGFAPTMSIRRHLREVGREDRQGAKNRWGFIPMCCRVATCKTTLRPPSSWCLGDLSRSRTNSHVSQPCEETVAKSLASCRVHGSSRMGLFA